MKAATGILLSLCLATLGACDSKSDDGKKDTKAAKSDKKGDKKADKKADKKGDKKEEKKAAGPLALPKTGLKVAAPEGARVSELMGNDMVQGNGYAVTVADGTAKPKTGEEAQKEADMYTPIDPKIEKLADGYILTFTNKGGAGTNYWVIARREIGGKAYACETNTSSEDSQKAGVAVCKGLTK